MTEVAHRPSAEQLALDFSEAPADTATSVQTETAPSPYDELAARRQAIIDSVPGATPERQRTLVRQRIWRDVAAAAIEHAITPDDVDALLGRPGGPAPEPTSFEDFSTERPLDARERQLPNGDRD